MKANAMLAGLVALGASIVSLNDAHAVEDAAGFYLLGSKGSMAGITPPPGIFVADVKYYYSGSASGDAAAGVALRRTGPLDRNITAALGLEVDVNVDAEAYFEAPTVIWVTPHKILGGNLGFSLAIPVGYEKVDVDIDATATLGIAPIPLILPNGLSIQRSGRFNITDETTNFGDPAVSALLGWHEGNFHWNVTATVNVPIGQWEKDNIANIGFNRWGLDTTAAFTWLDPKIGFEVSGAAGFTFNAENDDTDYKSGTEFHVEWALMQHFSKAFRVGLVGYHYDQVTGDSGAGATLGGFEGRATAIGPAVTYNFNLGVIPVSTSLNWLHEFNVENRAEGDSSMFIMSMPLWVEGAK